MITSFLGVGIAWSQTYPAKPIRIITSAPGGANDLLARMVGQGISEPLGQPVIVDNRGITGLDFVAKAAPDGYTLLLFGPPLWVGPLLQSAPYDALRDFAPITLMVRNPNILVVHPSVPVKSVKELINLAKARPGDLNYSSGSIGGSTHLAGELFKAMAGVNIVHVPYKGGGPALNDLIGGHVQLTFDGSNLVPHIKSRKLRPLAVTTLQTSALFPELPTIAASGLPGYEAVAFHGVFAPAKTAEAIVRRLNQEIVRVMKSPDAEAKLLATGFEPIGSSPEEFSVKIRSEIAKWSKVIKDAAIRLE
jgi:tripartite-type tricarboxylate transporter receptor subunit TctC